MSSTETIPHVVVGASHNVFIASSSWKLNVPLWGNIKLLVLYWGDKLIEYDREISDLQEISDILPQLGASNIKSYVFSERHAPSEICQEILRILREPEIVQLECVELRRTLEGINKHQFYVCEGDEDEAKVKAILEIRKTNLTAIDNRTIVIVRNWRRVPRLTELLKESRCQFALISDDMNQKEKDEIVKEFLDKGHLLISSIAWQSEICDAYFDSEIHMIIIYDCHCKK